MTAPAIPRDDGAPMTVRTSGLSALPSFRPSPLPLISTNPLTPDPDGRACFHRFAPARRCPAAPTPVRGARSAAPPGGAADRGPGGGRRGHPLRHPERGPCPPDRRPGAGQDAHGPDGRGDAAPFL